MSNIQPSEPRRPEAGQPTEAAAAVTDGPRFRGPFKRERRKVHEWRHSRPFWAGFFILLGSVPILYFPYATLEIGNVSVAMQTMAGAASAIIGCVLILLAIMIWVQPQFRVYAGVIALVCGFISFITSNLGGFFMGLLFVTIGGTLAIAWTYDEAEDDGADPAEPKGGAGDGGPELIEQPNEGLGIFVPPPTEAPEAAGAAKAGAAEGGVGLGEPSAGSASSRPGSTQDVLDSSARTLSGAAKFTAFAGIPTVAMVAALLPMGSPSDPLPPNPFADGPCVSASPTAGVPSGGATSTKPSSTAPAAPNATQQPVAPATPAAGSSTTAAKAPNAPAATPTTTKPGLLDPLKSVPILSDLLQPKSATAGTTGTTPPPATGGAPAAPKAAADPATTTPTAPTTQAPQPGATTAPTTDKPSTATPKPTSTGTKPPYPCPAEGPIKAKAATSGDPVLPDEPWILKTSLLAMAGMDYKGVVNVTTGSGKTKPVLKFEVSAGVDIWNLDMTSPVDQYGNRIHVFSTNNVKSYMKDGTVTFYTESLKGNLFGLIPIEFTPSSPPPLNVPVAFFTNVTVRQAGQTGATLVIPDMTMRDEKAS
ncbi:DUF6114 domain-containing protein [Yinghuangia seranimata]|uniref:DUF6114 domain-containing protein n=1 Tax=Yinghuangia seranimata TaxID=408067 RepID=UPI00248B620F|nr:DUF6114 domain-containing protein [Yinghuangia seranimata]MDI2128249.1 DUF6114 domain-containing protein [Yinghuangia seranimata]